MRLEPGERLRTRCDVRGELVTPSATQAPQGAEDAAQQQHRGRTPFVFLESVRSATGGSDLI